MLTKLCSDISCFGKKLYLPWFPNSFPYLSPQKNTQVPFQEKRVLSLLLPPPSPYKTTRSNNRRPLLQQHKLVPCNVLSLYPHNLIVLMKVIVRVMQAMNLHAGTCRKPLHRCSFTMVETFWITLLDKPTHLWEHFFADISLLFSLLLVSLLQ